VGDLLLFLLCLCAAAFLVGLLIFLMGCVLIIYKEIQKQLK